MKHFLFFVITSLLQVNISIGQQNQPNFISGDTIPSFQAKNQDNQIIVLDSLLQSSKYVAIVFYRGSWCPYCKRHISQLQDSLSLLQDQNTSVLVITPEKPESIEKMIRKSKASFNILHDSSYQIMKMLGIDYQVSKKTVTSMHGWVKNQAIKSNEDEIPFLPVSATFLVNKERVIRYLHYNKNYKERASVQALLNYIQKND